MKKKDLEKLLRKNGWKMERQGGNHEVWSNGISTELIPRHREINEQLAKAIIKKLGLEA